MFGARSRPQSERIVVGRNRPDVMSPTSRYPTISVVCDAFATMVALVLQLFKSTCDGGESANCTSGSVAVVGQVLDRLGEHGDIGVAQNLQRLAVVSVRCGAFSGLGRSEERPSFDGLCGEKAPICSRPNPIERAPDQPGSDSRGRSRRPWWCGNTASRGRQLPALFQSIPFRNPKPMLSCLWPPEKGRAAKGRGKAEARREERERESV